MVRRNQDQRHAFVKRSLCAAATVSVPQFISFNQLLFARRMEKIERRYWWGLWRDYSTGESGQAHSHGLDMVQYATTNPKHFVTGGPDPKLAEKWKGVLGGDSIARGHLVNWFDCIKTRRKPNADVETGHRTATLCNVIDIARQLGLTHSAW